MSSKSTVALTKLAGLRSREKGFKIEAEQRLRESLKLEGAGLHQQVAEALFQAKESGASWADIKRSYGTQDYATVKAIYDEAVSNGSLTSEVQVDGATWHWAGDNVVIESYVFEGQDIGGAVLIPSASGWDFQDPYVPLFDWFAAGHIDEYKKMVEGFVK